MCLNKETEFHVIKGIGGAQRAKRGCVHTLICSLSQVNTKSVEFASEHRLVAFW